MGDKGGNGDGRKGDGSMMDLPTFYTYVRNSPFGGRLTQEQVNGTEELLAAWNQYGDGDNRKLAYILAGVFHETGGKMVPVREGFASSDAGARRAVKSLFDQGRISVNYAIPVNGVSYYGRGRIQNTWERNYTALAERFGAPLVADPDLLLRDGALDAKVTVVGHLEGIWTGKKLSDYFNGNTSDPKGARRVVNGTDKSSLIATYYEAFLAAIKEAEKVEASKLPNVVARPHEVTAETATPDKPDLKKDQTAIGGVLAGIGGIGGVAAMLQPILAGVSSPWAFLAFALVAVGAFMVLTGRVKLVNQKGA